MFDAEGLTIKTCSTCNSLFLFHNLVQYIQNTLNVHDKLLLEPNHRTTVGMPVLLVLQIPVKWRSCWHCSRKLGFASNGATSLHVSKVSPLRKALCSIDFSPQGYINCAFQPGFIALNVWQATLISKLTVELTMITQWRANEVQFQACCSQGRKKSVQICTHSHNFSNVLSDSMLVQNPCTKECQRRPIMAIAWRYMAVISCSSVGTWGVHVLVACCWFHKSLFKSQLIVSLRQWGTVGKLPLALFKRAM